MSAPGLEKLFLIQNKKEKNQLLMFIRKSNSFLFPLYPDETQMSAKPNETKNWKKKTKKNSLTSTFLFSMAGTCVCVSEAADPEVHLTLRQWFSIRAVGQNTHTHTAVQDLCKH